MTPVNTIFCEVSLGKLRKSLTSIIINKFDIYKTNLDNFPCFLILFISKLKINRAWIGLNDRAREGTFRWDKGNAFGGFKSWHKGEPNNLGGKEDCVEMNKAHSWRLNDIDCTTKVGFICEINASKTVLNQYHW